MSKVGNAREKSCGPRSGLSVERLQCSREIRQCFPELPHRSGGPVNYLAERVAFPLLERTEQIVSLIVYRNRFAHARTMHEGLRCVNNWARPVSRVCIMTNSRQWKVGMANGNVLESSVVKPLVQTN